MGIFDNTSEITKKFITIVLCITVILLIFTVIIGLWIAAGKPSPTGGSSIPDTSAASLPGVPAKYEDTLLSDQNLLDGSTYVSMINAASIAMASDAGSAWSREHPDCQLYQAEADLVDIQGLAYRWSLIFESNGSMLMADVEDGHAVNVQSQDMEGLEMPPASEHLIYDSNSIMGMMTGNLSISAQAGNMLFSMKYSDTDNGVYDIVYNDPSNPVPYDISMDSVNGSIIQSTYRGPT